MSRRYFIELAYKGSAFHGWQIQPNALTVQETIEKAFSLVLRSSIHLTGCGRTDTGVHAKYFVAHFEYPNIADNNKLIYKLNSFLPNDIVIYSISEVPKECHARFSAISRAYEYHLQTLKDPFSQEVSYRPPFMPDFAFMNEAAKLLLTYSDFTSFSKLHTDVKTNNCKISKAKWVQNHKNQWIFHIEADRFLRNMVRAIVGTLLELGRHRLSIEEFKAIIEAKDRKKAGISVPGKGLFLTNVSYPPELFTPQLK